MYKQFSKEIEMTKKYTEGKKKYTEDYRTQMAVREMQIKATAGCHFPLSAWQRPFQVSVFAQPTWTPHEGWEHSNTASPGGRMSTVI